MSLQSWLFVGGYVIVAAITFSIWLQPEPRTSPFRAGLAASMAILFFLSSFAFGVWLSVMKMKGHLWIY